MRLGLLLYIFKSNHQPSAIPQWHRGIGDGLQIHRSGFDSYFDPSEFFFLKRDLDFHGHSQAEISRDTEISCRKREMSLSVWSMEMSANLKLAMGGYSPKEMNYSMNLMIF